MTHSQTQEAGRLMPVRLGSHKFAFGSASPEVRTAGAQENPRQLAEREDKLVGIFVLEGSLGKIEDKLVERLVTMRRRFRLVISQLRCQSAPAAQQLNR